MTFYTDYDNLRDATPHQLVHEHALALRDAAERAESIDSVLDHLDWLTAEQKQRAQRLIARADYRSLGKLLCDVHEQLVDARLAGAAPGHVVLWDEAH